MYLGRFAGSLKGKVTNSNAPYCSKSILRIILFLILGKEEAKTSNLKRCYHPRQNGKGYWRAIDRSFGYGLNVPRTRHASEIVKTKVPFLAFPAHFSSLGNQRFFLAGFCYQQN